MKSNNFVYIILPILLFTGCGFILYNQEIEGSEKKIDYRYGRIENFGTGEVIDIKYTQSQYGNLKIFVILKNNKHKIVAESRNIVPDIGDRFTVVLCDYSYHLNEKVVD